MVAAGEQRSGDADGCYEDRGVIDRPNGDSSRRTRFEKDGNESFLERHSAAPLELNSRQLVFNGRSNLRRDSIIS
jgi:hypothetical protein